MREALAPALRAAGVTALVAVAAWVLLDPPSFSGVGDLLRLGAGALALAIGTAWLTVALSGRDSMSEREVDRLIRRSDYLARRHRLAPSSSEFELLVSDAIDRLPVEFQRALTSTPVVVSRRGAQANAYGHYSGDTVARDDHPDRIVIYQDTLERDFGHDRELLAAQVERTLQHELAHHLGWEEPGVRGLGL